MGRYTDWGAVVARYPSPANSRDETSMEAAFITGAEDEIDARLSSRYSVPFTTVPGIIADLATDMAYIKLRHYHKDVQGIVDRVEARLKDIVNGTTALPGATESLGNSASVSATYHSPFGVDDDVNWRRDPSQIDDEEDSRE